MKLRILLGHVDEAQRAGELQGSSPVFAVIRNESVRLKSAEAWDAVSIIGVEVDEEAGAVDLIADPAENAKDISVESLRARVSRLPGGCLEHEVFVRELAGDDDEDEPGANDEEEPCPSEGVPVVEAYGDEHGLGLMLWFEGYEDWIPSQG